MKNYCHIFKMLTTKSLLDESWNKIQTDEYKPLLFVGKAGVLPKQDVPQKRTLNHYKIIVLFFLIVQSNILFGGWKTDRELLDQLYKIADFRIFYTLKGRHSLPKKNTKDLNHNNVPDYIEHIGLKLSLANVLFNETFGLRHPFQSLRYKDQVRHIDVHMLNIDGKGSSGDGVHHFVYKKFPLLKGKSLTIKLSIDLRDRTLTPSHELFHLYQNGYTMFKNRWYTEGTARWAEYAQKEGTGLREQLPKTVTELNRLLQQTYETKSFWRRLAYLLDKNNGKFAYPIIAQQKVNGFPVVIEDNRIYGYNFIKRFLEALDQMDATAEKNYGLSAYDWEEEIQKSAKNNIYILCGLKYTIQDEYKGMDRVNEIDDFLKILEKATEYSCEKLHAN